MFPMLNRDVYYTIPTTDLPGNSGVAEVSDDRSVAAQSVLRYELETFVCAGDCERDLKSILHMFLVNLHADTKQPRVWISGHSGSGKSHLTKMLRTLWADYRLDDGSTARSLVKLPTGVFELLKQLSTRGTLHAIAGKLSADMGDKFRLALLGMVFRSKGLPEQYNQAQLMLWMKREGILPTVDAELKAAGRSLVQELPDMYVSSYLAIALLKARPDFAHTEADARKLLKEQFPQVTDVTREQMAIAIDAALTVDGSFPLTLVVLDEVQQYVGSDVNKAFQVHETIEALSILFGGKLLFVCTGQSAMTASPALAKLMDRFPIHMMPAASNVSGVTRRTILAKKPSAQPEIERLWRAHLGEISRHLRGTRLEHVASDEDVMASDYPLLPVRRRFWECVLRTIDNAGCACQLRSQLRIIHEAVLATADQPLGHVVPSDFLYGQIAADLVSTGQLPKDVHETVQCFESGDAQAQLKGRLMKLIYLINKLPAEEALFTGLKATEEALADLLVTDLAADSSELRKQLPALLGELQYDRLVIALTCTSGTEYRLRSVE